MQADDVLVVTFVDEIEKSLSPLQPRDCHEILQSGRCSDGVYTVYPNGTESGIEVYCDMTLMEEDGRFVS